MYVALEDTIDPLNFCDSFGRSLNDTSDEEPSTLTTSDVSLPVNPYLPQNLFATQYIDQDTGLDTDSIADFNAMRSSVLSESDTNNPQLYPHWEYVSTFSLSASISGLIKSKNQLNPNFCSTQSHGKSVWLRTSHRQKKTL